MNIKNHCLIRTANIEDALAIYSAEKKTAATPGFLVSQPHELQLESFQKKIVYLNSIPNGYYVVAEENGSIVAHAMLDPMGLEAIHHISRLTIVVHQGYYERGIGFQLMQHLISWAKTAPVIEKIELNVRATNTRAIKLYEKCGFKEEGRICKRIKTSEGSYIDDVEMGLFVKNVGLE